MSKKMLLCKEIILDLDKSNDLNELIEFKYKLIIHSSNEEEALISLIFKRTMNCFLENKKIIEYEQVKIPQNITLKDWLIIMILEKDELLKNPEKLPSKKDKEAVMNIKKTFEERMLKIKIKTF